MAAQSGERLVAELTLGLELVAKKHDVQHVYLCSVWELPSLGVAKNTRKNTRVNE